MKVESVEPRYKCCYGQSTGIEIYCLKFDTVLVREINYPFVHISYSNRVLLLNAGDIFSKIGWALLS